MVVNNFRGPEEDQYAELVHISKEHNRIWVNDKE